ncbi:MAG TPA: heme ABC exporter ATP-binding protein CcmA [Candidatus Saccharimonadia bacterium]|nr:heme ABC exporter ATP-binding protein CcmA [Candidatus Saccharimonadia bacterium]
MSEDVPNEVPLLAARALAFSRGDEAIFGPLDFTLAPHETLVMEGGNGAGKTTLIRVLAGLLQPGSGSIEWRGEPLATLDPDPGRIALLGHHVALKADLTPRENLKFRIALQGLRAGITIVAAMKSVGLEGYEDVAVRTLSAGQRKRTALAALLLSPALVWLLDEPYANLDREGQVLVDRMLEAHATRGGATVLTSHGLVQPALARCRFHALGVAA